MFFQRGFMVSYNSTNCIYDILLCNEYPQSDRDDGK